MTDLDFEFMDLAMSLARSAASLGEVPVGAVVVANKQVISCGVNLKESQPAATKHAEIIAIEKASLYLQAWRLTDCDLYVTLEPCLMCAGAIYQARLRRVIFASADPKAGALGSLYSIQSDNRLNHQFEVKSGVRKEESSQLLKDFFRSRRKKRPPKGGLYK